MKRAVIAALLLIAALALWWLFSRSATPVRGEPVEPPATTSEPRAAPTESAAQPIVLPDTTVPRREAWATLDAAARAGQPEAACRLAIEIVACRLTRGMGPVMQSLEDRLEMIEAMPIDEERRRRQAEFARADYARIEAAEERCAGEDDVLPDPIRYFAMAGRAGHAPSQLYYLSFDALSAGALLRDPSLAIEYRANAPVFFRALIERGDPRILNDWAAALAFPQDSALAVVLPEKWKRPGLLQALREELDALPADRRPPGPRQRFAATPTAEDRAEARRLFETHFRNAAPPPPTIDAALASYEFGESAQLACAELAQR